MKRIAEDFWSSLTPFERKAMKIFLAFLAAIWLLTALVAFGARKKTADPSDDVAKDFKKRSINNGK